MILPNASTAPVKAAAATAFALGALAACSPATQGGSGAVGSATLASTDAACVPIPDNAVFRENEGKLVQVRGDDNAFFQMVDGVLTEVDAPEPEVIERVIEAPQSWSEQLEASFPSLGFPWLKLDARNLDAGVVTLTGLAPTEDAKARALQAGESAISATSEGGNLLVVDGISVEGGEAAVGEALAGLNDRPSVSACQDAFDDTMAGRLVSFGAGGAQINDESARLLDALTGVAILCADYRIEVGGHTDTTGSALANQVLSEDRAAAVRQYLIDRGVSASTLRAVGYGEVRPLVQGNTPEAHARNRRVEFTVRNR